MAHAIITYLSDINRICILPAWAIQVCATECQGNITNAHISTGSYSSVSETVPMNLWFVSVVRNHFNSQAQTNCACS